MIIPVLKKFLPQTLVKISSPINGEISVVEQFGRRKILIANLTQSGPMVEKIWEPIIKKIAKDENKIAEVLILGLGGGSLVKLANNYFKKIKITGLEIDPIIIDLGKKYFYLESFSNLKIKNESADLFLNKNKLKFDLIFVDLYLGDKVPKNCESEIFLENLKKSLTNNGMIVFNRLYYKNHIFEAKKFLDKLRKIFHYLSCRKYLTNFFILVKKD